MTQPQFPGQVPAHCSPLSMAGPFSWGAAFSVPGERGGGGFLFCVLLGLPCPLSLLALLVQLLEFGGTGGQPLLVRPVVLLFMVLPGSLHSLRHLHLMNFCCRGVLSSLFSADSCQIRCPWRTSAERIRSEDVTTQRQAAPWRGSAPFPRPLGTFERPMARGSGLLSCSALHCIW